MKKIFAFIWMAGMVFVFAACGISAPTLSQMGGTNTLSSTQRETLSEADEPNVLADTTEDDLESEISIFLTVGEYRFSATLLSSETTAAFTEYLPLTLNMSELNGNEKYFYLDNSLPTDSVQPGQIHAGDLMLYGNNCLVLFYESFSSGYSYTKLGSLDDPAGLAEALGSGSAEITFSIGSE